VADSKDKITFVILKMKYQPFILLFISSFVSSFLLQFFSHELTFIIWISDQAVSEFLFIFSI